jgi:hypothetical protein
MVDFIFDDNLYKLFIDTLRSSPCWILLLMLVERKSENRSIKKLVWRVKQ